METQKLLDILSQIKHQIEVNTELTGSDKVNFLKKIESIEKAYTSLAISNPFEDLYASLIKRGNELILELKKNKNSKELIQQITYYLRYIHASEYDFKGNIRGVNHYTRIFMVTAALFMALTPQFYGFVLPVFFILPIFSGLRGIRRRSRTGLLMTLTIVPMALMSSITWIRYFTQVAVPNFNETVAATSAAWNVSSSAAHLLIIVPSILSAVLVIVSLLTAYLGYKYRHMFV